MVDFGVFRAAQKHWIWILWRPVVPLTKKLSFCRFSVGRKPGFVQISGVPGRAKSTGYGYSGGPHTGISVRGPAGISPGIIAHMAHIAHRFPLMTKDLNPFLYALASSPSRGGGRGVTPRQGVFQPPEDTPRIPRAYPQDTPPGSPPR